MKYFKKFSKYATCLILSLCFLLMGTFNINADNNTFIVVEDNITTQVSNNEYLNWQGKIRVVNSISEVRVVALPYNTDNFKYALWVYAVSINDFNMLYSNGSSIEPNSSTNSYTQDGYYIRVASISQGNGNASVIPTIPYFKNVSTSYSSTTALKQAISYTFGDNAIGPTPPIQWGTLKDIGFSTSLATNGTVNVGLNRDKIYWNGLTDTLDNELTEIQKVEIHAQGTYYTQVQSGVISLTEWLSSITFDDIQLSGTSDILLGTFNANKGYAEFSWNAVANALNIPIQNTSAYKDNDIWYQEGWIYKVRLTDPDTGYVGNWQTLYTITAMPPESTQDVYNTSFLNENIINVVNEVNNINNETNENNYVTENYEINNTVINYPENPDGNKIIDDSIEQEDEYITQLDTQLTDIDTSPLDLLGIQGIQNAFEWIRTVHLRTVEQTTLGTVTGIIMLIGLAVYLIGRRRG